MSPEFQRNLWLEATPGRLGLTAVLLLLVFLAASVAPPGFPGVPRVAEGLYDFLVILWGTRSAALAVVGEIRERTWDSQRLSSIEPFDMMWGKLFGATIHNWFGGAICLPFILYPVFLYQGLAAALTALLIFLALGVLAQATSLLASLNLVRRRHNNWRLDTFLCQVAGIAAAVFYYGVLHLPQAAPQLTARLPPLIGWWSWAFPPQQFQFVSLILFTGWALVGCYRAMRLELRFENGPFVWLAFLLFLCLYEAGLESWFTEGAGRGLAVTAGLAGHGGVFRLAIAAFTLLGSTYGMVLLEPKDPVRLRWLGEQLRGGRVVRAFLWLDAWMLSFGAAILVLLALAFVLAQDSSQVAGHALAEAAWPVLQTICFLIRDVAIFLLCRSWSRQRGDFAALGVLAALYVLAPMIFAHSAALMLFLPSLLPPHWPALLGVALEAVAAWFWLLRRLGRQLR